MTTHTRSLWLTLALALTIANAPAQDGRYRDPVFPQVTVQADVAYGQAVNSFTLQPETLLLDVYEPVGDIAPARPAIVLMHGGGFVVGSRSDPNYVAIAEAFARRGYVAVSISYRLARPPFSIGFQQAIIDASHDLKAAVRWLRSQAGPLRLDPARIVTLGGSAGGIAALQAAYTDALGEGSSGNPGFSSGVRGVISLWGSMPDVTEMEGDEAPLQIIHGTNDPIVPYQSALDLKTQADAVGLHAELLPIPGGSHSEYQAYLQTYLIDSLAFLYEQMALGELAGLTVRPGFASPGVLTVDTFGPAGDGYLIAYAPSPASLPLPGLGTLCIGPAQQLVFAVQGTLPGSPRIGTASHTLQVPAGIAGLRLFWQAAYFDGPDGRWLTNCIETRF